MRVLALTLFGIVLSACGTSSSPTEPPASDAAVAPSDAGAGDTAVPVVVLDAAMPTSSEGCNNGVKDPGEVDVDCGGVCPQCATGRACTLARDCASKNCQAGKCAEPTCADGAKNGPETDVDCGGSCPNKCSDSQSCSGPSDCASNLCTNGRCAPASCVDGKKTSGETDVDCGGVCFSGCAVARGCQVDSDCIGGRCSSGACASCGGTDTDCGGACPLRCALGKACKAHTDCATQFCSAQKCATPPVASSCKSLLTLHPDIPSGAYLIDPDGPGSEPAFSTYCDMTTDGGGWTLVRVDDTGSTNNLKTAAAVGTVFTTSACRGQSAKLSDAVIKSMWTSQLRYTTELDGAGDMTYLSNTDVRALVSWSDQCGSNNKIRWFFKRAPAVLSSVGTHGEYCGWSFGPCNGNESQLCWYGPHQGYRVHCNPTRSHLAIPSHLNRSDVGCGLGWVR